MPRALRGIVQFLLAIAVVVPAPLASAQMLGRFRRQQTPVQKGRQDVNTFLTDERQRLAEMQVELALLSDLATFPYEFSPRANGNTLELRGNVPNEMIRQRAMDVTRNTTFLRGIDALRIQPNLSVRSTLRPSGVVQHEGMELLQKALGSATQQISLEVRPNGVVVLTGRTDCIESKLDISRLFRRLPGCTAVVNELAIEPVLVDGQRMVRVTHNNMLLVPPSAVAQDVEAVPTSSTPREPSTPTKPAAEKIGNDWESFAPSKLPVKWGRPAGSWEAQTKEIEALHPQPAPVRMVGRPSETKWASASGGSNQPGNTIPGSQPKISETQQKPESMLTWKRPGGSEESEPKEGATATEPRTSQVGAGAIREQLVPSPTYIGSSDSSTYGPGSSPPSLSSVRSARRWPSAYVTAPPPGQGRPGVISFDDDSPPAPKPAPVVMTTSRSATPAKPSAPTVTAAPPAATPIRPVTAAVPTSRSPDAEFSAPPPARPTVYRSQAATQLQRKIKSICGRHAREVTAIVQKDGIVLVRVKVADLAVEEKLSPRILSLPEMNAPEVRLMIEVGP